jgi:hypothetical protein
MPEEEKKWKRVSSIAISSEKTAEIFCWEEGKPKYEKIEFKYLNLENIKTTPRVILMLHFFPGATCTLEREVLTCRREVPS